MENKPRIKTKLELILGFCRYFVKYLDDNKLEAAILFLGISFAILFLGISFAIVAYAISANPEAIKAIIEASK